DLEAINPDTPILGEIPLIPNAKQDLKGGQKNSQTDEAFRTLGHNLNFMLGSEPKEGGHVIGVTSSVKGEGKTTIAFNLAQTYFQLKKSVLLVGADLRNPQLHPYINESKDALGLSNLLIDGEAQWEQLVFNIATDSKRFDVLLSGAIPPMPSVLLSSQRFKDFLEEARKQYDYVIIDTAPTLLVADTLTFINNTDFTIYVVRSGITEKQLIDYSKKLVDQKKIPQMAYVINDMDYKGSYGYGYNYGYGYGYNAEIYKKPWYQFWN